MKNPASCFPAHDDLLMMMIVMSPSGPSVLRSGCGAPVHLSLDPFALLLHLLKRTETSQEAEIPPDSPVSPSLWDWVISAEVVGFLWRGCLFLRALQYAVPLHVPPFQAQMCGGWYRLRFRLPALTCCCCCCFTEPELLMQVT